MVASRNFMKAGSVDLRYICNFFYFYRNLFSKSHYWANSFTLFISLDFGLEHYETSSSNFNLKDRCIFFMYFMGDGFQTIYCFCKECHLRSYRVSGTSFSSFWQQFQVQEKQEKYPRKLQKHRRKYAETPRETEGNSKETGETQHLGNHHENHRNLNSRNETAKCILANCIYNKYRSNISHK